MKIQLPAHRKARIEMLPLIDIVFLLLVFFIYAMLSMAVHRGLPVELPLSTTAEIDKKLILSVTIKADGTIYVDQESVALMDLTRVLQGMSGNTRQPGVLIFADRALPYQMIYNVLDKIRQAGLSRISLQADFEE
ncbi:MAG: biopolymer transporter ExbD [Deltaproteobacteria bacterium]|nr:biopolymer transporter ExbD [Deltaproteobacteria bacterium]